MRRKREKKDRRQAECVGGSVGFMNVGGARGGGGVSSPEGKTSAGSGEQRRQR